MADITLTVPDDKYVDIQDAFALMRGYSPLIEDDENPGQMIANPETKEEFMHRKLVEFIQDTYKAAQVTINGAANREATLAAAEIHVCDISCTHA